MKDYNFSNNYENVDSWSIEKDLKMINELSYGDKLINLFRSYPNFLNSLKTKNTLHSYFGYFSWGRNCRVYSVFYYKYQKIRIKAL